MSGSCLACAAVEPPEAAPYRQVLPFPRRRTLSDIPVDTDKHPCFAAQHLFGETVVVAESAERFESHATNRSSLIMSRPLLSGFHMTPAHTPGASKRICSLAHSIMEGQLRQMLMAFFVLDMAEW